MNSVANKLLGTLKNPIHKTPPRNAFPLDLAASVSSATAPRNKKRRRKTPSQVESGNLWDLIIKNTTPIWAHKKPKEEEPTIMMKEIPCDDAISPLPEEDDKDDDSFFNSDLFDNQMSDTSEELDQCSDGENPDDKRA